MSTPFDTNHFNSFDRSKCITSFLVLILHLNQTRKLCDVFQGFPVKHLVLVKSDHHFTLLILVCQLKNNTVENNTL